MPGNGVIVSRIPNLEIKWRRFTNGEMPRQPQNRSLRGLHSC